MTTQRTDLIEPGLRSRMREALHRISDEVAAKNTRTAIAVPGPEIFEAMTQIFSDVPHIPDFDPAAEPTVYSSYTEYVSDQVPPDPVDVTIRARTGDDSEPQAVIHLVSGSVHTEVPFDPDVAEQLFLAGLAACGYVRKLRDAPLVD